MRPERRSAIAAARVLCAALAFAGCASEPLAPLDEDLLAMPRVVPLERYQGRLPMIRVRLASGPRDFLCDTGGGWTLVSPAVAVEVGCVETGRSVGYRMSGERIEVPLCDEPVAMTLGDVAIRPDSVGVFDIMTLLPAGLPPLHGVISLRTLYRRAITLDLQRGRLILETPASLAARTRSMTPLVVRLTTGMDGAGLALFLAATTPSLGAEPAWLEFDTGNLDTVLLAPHVAHRAGLAVGTTEGSVALSLAPGFTFPTRVRVRDLIHDGALNLALIEAGVFAIDLADGRAWGRPARRP
jgi:hypothetical protein